MIATRCYHLSFIRSRANRKQIVELLPSVFAILRYSIYTSFCCFSAEIFLTRYFHRLSSRRRHSRNPRGRHVENAGMSRLTTTAVATTTTHCENGTPNPRTAMDVYHAPQYLPDLVLDIVFANLEPRDLLNCMLVCQNWRRILDDPRAEPWKILCRRKVPRELLKSDFLAQLKSPKAKVRALYHAWNPDDCSTHIVVKQNGFTLHRNPVAQSTDMARTRIGYANGKHVWEVTWTGPLGTVAMVGVSTKEAAVQCGGYVPLLGNDNHSWGWNLIDNDLLHCGVSQGKYPLLNNAPKYQIGEKLQLVLDCENGVLHFEKCNEFLGIAFKNLPKTKLYPSVSAVYGNTEISIVYIGKPLCG